MPISKRHFLMKFPLLLASVALRGGSIKADEDSSTLIYLDSSWKFRTDPINIGASDTHHWYSDTFDDGDWETLSSGEAWENQGVSYSGYAWYRKRIIIPASPLGVPLTLHLASIISDDDVYFNGIRVGGLKGDYKYRNLLDRQYVIPSSLVRYGTSNTVAIRIWGGNIVSQPKRSGLVAGAYRIAMDRLRISVRPPGGSLALEKPIELYDFSAACQGANFDLVFPFVSRVIPPGASPSLTYDLSDFYGFPIKNGMVGVSVDADGIARGVVSVDSASARTIYLAGRFKAGLVLKDRATGEILSKTEVRADHLSFGDRDSKKLTPLPVTYETTPYGNLRLIDAIDCSTDLSVEEHPYLESAFGNHEQDRMSPGVRANVSVNPIMGKRAREATWSWFAYRIGRGRLVIGKCYLLRVEYPEDKPRYCPLEIQIGRNYFDVGWKNGLSADDIYENWPLSHDWQYFDVIIPLDRATTATGGTEDGNAENGFYVYFMDKRKPGYYFSSYLGGPAVSTIKLFEIDPELHEPKIILPPPELPQRVITVDWERQPTSVPLDIVNYAKLMGYSAVSPVILKWGRSNYGLPLAGYDSASVDEAGYLVTSRYDPKTKMVPEPAAKGLATAHTQYLEATNRLGIDYIPRFEYGGSLDLPSSAWAIGADGNIARPNRFASWGANLLHPATYDDLKNFLDSLIKPFAVSNPQLKGVLWRVRSDRMQISYGPGDVALFCKETGMASPTAFDKAQLAKWASTGKVGADYATWWHGKRRDFHYRLVSLLKSYRADLNLYYYNWDADKFSLIDPDVNSAAFYHKVALLGGPAAYEVDRRRRATYTAADYIAILNTGDFSSSFPSVRRPEANWADYGLRPKLYANIAGVQLLAPVNSLACAKFPDYVNYFETHDGVAVSNAVPYDEVGAREPNPKYEGSMMLPGGGPFSMAMELLSYYHGDVRTLTYTVYTYGRGFADAHRRFTQAFRALPAIPGALVTNTPTDVAARLYLTDGHGTYVGIAYKGYVERTLTVELPGMWTPQVVVTNLVCNEILPTVIMGGKLQVTLRSGPMELHALHIS